MDLKKRLEVIQGQIEKLNDHLGKQDGSTGEKIDVEQAELANTGIPSIDKERVQKAANQNLQEALEQSVIPQEYWDEIKMWVEETHIDQLYLDSKERLGAWWAAREVKSMGFSINFTKSEKLPSEWFPEGTDWDVAQAEARFRLVAAWEMLLANEALVKME